MRNHLLTGVMRCGKPSCEGRLAGNWVMKTEGGHAIAYSCKTCRGVSVRAEHVEPLVIGAVVARLIRPDAAKLLRATGFDAAEAARLRTEEAVLLAPG